MGANRTDEIKAVFYPETMVGGFSSVDGTIQFYTRVNAILEKTFVVVDLGAGRGAGHCDDPVPYRRALMLMKGKCAKVIGLDFDDVVLNNPAVDEAKIIGADGRLPLNENSIDLILSDAVFEHVSEPRRFASEIYRVLKPGGWVCARTPNRYGYIGIGANLIPNSLHVSLLKYLQPPRDKIDVFPAFYKINSRSRIHRYFPNNNWDSFIYSWNAEPAYFGRSRVAWFIMKLFFRICPEAFGAIWNIFLKKK